MRIGNRSAIVFCDNLNRDTGIPALENESVALTFTSPPYWNYIAYAGKKGGGYEKSYQGYLETLRETFDCMARKTIVGGRAVINVSNMKSRLAVEGSSFIYPIVSDMIQLMQSVGFTFFDEIIWVKGSVNRGALKGRYLFGSYPYPPTPKILDSMFENILIFTKPGKRPKVDPDIKDRSKLSKREWRTWTRGLWHIRPDRDRHHPATFPMELATRIIRLYSFVEDVVLDPFAGSGTAVIAAEKYHRKGIGFEISETYQTAVHEKAEKWLHQLELFQGDTLLC